jgi:hypothetical protein
MCLRKRDKMHDGVKGSHILDEIFVVSNVTVTIVPIIPYGNIIRGR